MCDCRKDLETRLLEQFKSVAPEATGHEVSLKGYAFFFSSDVSIKGVMAAEKVAEFPLKNGGFKRKIEKFSMVFSYCPFCGVAYERN